MKIEYFGYFKYAKNELGYDTKVIHESEIPEYEKNGWVDHPDKVKAPTEKKVKKNADNKK